MKLTELKISVFYQWNYEIQTFYDHLELFLSLGTVFENDCIQFSNYQSILQQKRTPTHKKLKTFKNNAFYKKKTPLLRISKII